MQLASRSDELDTLGALKLLMHLYFSTVYLGTRLIWMNEYMERNWEQQSQR